MKKNGFTIIELMIAAAILGFMIAGMTLALLQQQRQFNISREAVDVDQTGRAVLDYLASEIKNSASREGKTFSLTFVNGGSSSDCANNTADKGSVDSPPDCLTIYTWDITRGMNPDPGPGEVRLPSIASAIEISSSASSLVLSLPDSWFQTNGKLIGETESDQEVLIGVRSRSNLCNPDPNISCLANPDSCTECSAILKGQVSDSSKTITFDDISDLKAHNFPVTYSSIGTFITGQTPADNGNNYGFIDTFNAQTSEMTIVDSKSFRVDTDKRQLEMSQNDGPFQPIAGGSTADTPEVLDAPGIVDLQFVFNMQNQDGSITKVGFCSTSTCPCDTSTSPDPPPATQSDFSCGPVRGREGNIRSVEIYLVVKSKTKPQNLSGGTFEQTIPQLGDVLERTVDDPSDLKEPEEGFIYRIHSTTVYPRNMAREDFG